MFSKTRISNYLTLGYYNRFSLEKKASYIIPIRLALSEYGGHCYLRELQYL